MSTQVDATVNQITTQTLTYAPAVLAGIQAAEQSGADGQTKKQAVLNGILAGSQGIAGANIPTVSGIAALIDLFVSIFNATGLFKKKANGGN